jgi:nicotinamidase-related amidase
MEVLKKMKTAIWENMLTDADREVIKKGGYGQPKGLGHKPLLLIIDLQPNYVGADKPITAQLDEWPSGGGETAWRCVERILQLRDAARVAEVPVFYTKNVQKQGLKFDAFSSKTVRDQSKYLDGNPASELLPVIQPREDEPVIAKAYPSAFYGTPLQSYLIRLGIDTLIITGGSTGGCCRATAVDAVSRGYNLAVVQDCVYDRIELSHKASLLDIWMKYGDIPTSEAILKYFRQVKEVTL